MTLPTSLVLSLVSWGSELYWLLCFTLTAALMSAPAPASLLPSPHLVAEVTAAPKEKRLELSVLLEYKLH